MKCKCGVGMEERYAEWVCWRCGHRIKKPTSLGDSAEVKNE